MFPMFRDYNLSPPQRRESKQGKEKGNGGGGGVGGAWGMKNQGHARSRVLFFLLLPSFNSPSFPLYLRISQPSVKAARLRKTKKKEASAFQKVKLSEMEGTSRGPV